MPRIIPLPHRATPLPPYRKLSLMRIVLSCMPDSISTPGISNFSRSRLSLSPMHLTLSLFSVSLRMIDAEAIEQNLFYLVCLSCIFTFFSDYICSTWWAILLIQVLTYIYMCFKTCYGLTTYNWRFLYINILIYKIKCFSRYKLSPSLSKM